ncbi:MAG: GNAT family N-acetyltransferase [Pyrinomonadaceae bacterium]
MASVLETPRLALRELDSAADAEFIFELLNSPKFIKYIGDRGVRSVEQAREFIDDRYRASYREHGYGLYAVDQRSDGSAVGICGFVKRDYLEHADIGFAFLPEFERRGYGFESASAALRYGRDSLGFQRVFAITSQDNDVSGKLLSKLGFARNGIVATPDGEELNLHEITL